MAAGLYDLHCHLLPALDDGPPDEAHAVALARALVADGVSTVAATPHRTRGLATPVRQLQARVELLRELLAREQVELEVLIGSEVSVDALIDMEQGEVEALRLGGSGPVLVELPLQPSAGDPAWPVRELLATGIPVLLAHVERIPMFQRDSEPLAVLLEDGAWAQVNAGSLLGHFGAQAQATAVTLLDAGLVDVLASDAHHHALRPPQLAAARQWLAHYRPRVDADALTVHTPRVLVHPRAPRVTAAGEPAAPPPAQRVAVNTVLRAATEVLGKVATLVLTVVMIHQLGKGPVGDFAFALALTQLYWPIAGFGLDRLLLRDTALDSAAPDRLVPQLNAFKLLVGGLCTVAGTLIVAQLDRGSSTLTWTTAILGATLVATLFGATAQSVFMAHERTQDYFVAALPVKVAGSVLGIFVLLLGGGIVAVATTSLAAALLGIGIGWALLVRKYHVRGMRLGGTPRTWGSLARRSGPWGVQEIFGQIIFRAGIIVIFLYAGAAATADYRLAYQLLEASLFIPWSVGTSVLPLIARARGGRDAATMPEAHEPLVDAATPDEPAVLTEAPLAATSGDEPDLPTITRASLELVLALMLPLAVLMALCAHPILTAIYGADGADAAVLLPYLAVASIAYAVGHIAGLVALSHLPGRRTVEITAVAAIFTLALLLWLVPDQGSEGAAIAALATETLLAVMTVWLAVQAAGWSITRGLLSLPLLGAVAMALVVTPFRDNLWISLLLGSAVYLLVVGALEYRRKGPAFTVISSLVSGHR